MTSKDSRKARARARCPRAVRGSGNPRTAVSSNIHPIHYRLRPQAKPASASPTSTSVDGSGIWAIEIAPLLTSSRNVTGSFTTVVAQDQLAELLRRPFVPHCESKLPPVALYE